MSVAFDAHGDTVPTRGATISATPVHRTGVRIPIAQQLRQLPIRVRGATAPTPGRSAGTAREPPAIDGMDLPQPGQQGSGAKRRKGVAAFQMDQMHVSGEPPRTRRDQQGRGDWSLKFQVSRGA
jgi:hypothetical protein